MTTTEFFQSILEVPMARPTCQDCGNKWTVRDSFADEMLQDGRLVEQPRLVKKRNRHGQDVDAYENVLLGICPRCRTTQRKAVERALTVEEESAAIRKLMARLREQHPEWSLEKAAHQAVEEFNDPAKERNPGFRAYLLDRE